MSAETQLKAALGALSDGDWGRLGSLLSDSFFTYRPGPGEPTASERIIGLLTDLKTAIPDLVATIEDLDRKADFLIGVLKLSGTHQNPLWGAPGSGNRFEWANPVTIKMIGDTLAVRLDDVDLPSVIGAFHQLGMVNAPDEMDQPVRYPASIPEFLLKVLLTGQAADKECSHLDQIGVVEPSTHLCAPCVAEGTIWPALRMCLICGHVGCCDTSKNKHAMQHFEETGHPLMRSIRMDEGWVWCYVDSAFFERDLLDRYR